MRTLRIAIADDDTEIRNYFANAMTQLGHEIVVSADSGEALILGCRQTFPDLVISDVRMGSPNGVDAVRELSQDQDFRVILISAHHRWEDLEEDIRERVLVFMTKPVKLADLKSAIIEFAAATS